MAPCVSVLLSYSYGDSKKGGEISACLSLSAKRRRCRCKIHTPLLNSSIKTEHEKEGIEGCTSFAVYGYYRVRHACEFGYLPARCTVSYSAEMQEISTLFVVRSQSWHSLYLRWRCRAWCWRRWWEQGNFWLRKRSRVILREMTTQHTYLFPTSF